MMTETFDAEFIIRNLDKLFMGLALRKSLFGISAAGANKEIFAAIALSIYTGQGGFLNNCQNIWHGVIRHEKKNRKNKNICYNSGSQHGP